MKDVVLQGAGGAMDLEASTTTTGSRGILERIRRFAMPAGPVECKGTWLRQEGEMRFAPDKPWLSFTAEQWFEGDGVDFRWDARVRMAPLVSAHVLDSFEHGRGLLTAKLWGVIPLARSSGPAMHRGEALRGLAELPWRPFAFRNGPLLSWEATTAEKLRATFDDGKTVVSAEFQVDGDGRVLGGIASKRPRIVGRSIVETPWSGTIGGYAMFDGIRVPSRAEATWHLAEGPFTYWRARVIDFGVLQVKRPCAASHLEKT